MGWLRPVAACLVVVSVALSPILAEAQRPDDVAFEGGATGVVWGFAALELGAAVTAALSAATLEGCSGLECLRVLPVISIGAIASVVAGIAMGLIAGFTELDPDGAFVIHQSVFGATAGGLLAGGVGAAADLGSPGYLGLGVGAGTGIGLGTYTAFRADHLLDNPETAAATTVMFALPLILTPLTFAIGKAAGLSDATTSILAGALLVAQYAATIAWAETRDGPSTGAAMSPLVDRTVPGLSFSF
ncbi:MAG: hypothetical protein AAGF12_21070 [Myxococcota bacterium]